MFFGSIFLLKLSLYDSKAALRTLHPSTLKEISERKIVRRCAGTIDSERNFAYRCAGVTNSDRKFASRCAGVENSGRNFASRCVGVENSERKFACRRTGVKIPGGNLRPGATA